MVKWVVAGLGVLLALMALAAMRRLTRRLDALTQSYWELRYDYTRLRSRVSRLDPEDPPSRESGPSGAAPVSTAADSPSVTFVPLSTIRKKRE